MLSCPITQTGAAARCRLLLTEIAQIARPMPCVLPVEWTLDANGSGENHRLALPDH